MTHTTTPIDSSQVWRRRISEAVAVLLAATAIFVGVRWGTFVAGGSDSYCYLGQARMWLDGEMLQPFDPGFEVTWPNATLSLAPTGFIPSKSIPGALAPICPPGLSIVMAGGASLAGTAGAYAIVPASGGLLVWSAFVLGRRLAGPVAGLLAAVLIVTSPIVLFQLVQPMSDVPTAALWLASLALAASGTPARAFAAGLAASVAILIRPNLAPLALPVGALIPCVASRGTLAQRLRSLLPFLIGILPGPIAVAALNRLLYGSALASGYGNPADLFSIRHVPVNAAQYARWLLDLHTPWILVGLAAPWVLGRTGKDGLWSVRVLAGACVCAIFIVVAIYLPYSPFDSWTYLRFLLPVIALLVVLGSAVTVTVADRLRPQLRAAVLVLVAAALALHGLYEARTRHAFDAKTSEQRYRDVGEWIGRELPNDAVIVTVFQSGSVRYYGDRVSVLWDAMAPDQLPALLTGLYRAGRRPFLLFLSWEIPRFQSRFGPHTDIAKLDWPPRATIGRDIVLYDVADRDRHLAGGPVRSERVFTTAERQALGRR